MAAAQTIFVVRHAERTGEPDPPLNAEGLSRARTLARILTDANVTRFFASDTIRAQQTAEPTAKSAGRKVKVIPQGDLEALIRAVRSPADGEGATLVVGHRATVPRIVARLGGGEVAPLGSAEHDRLIVLTLLPDGKASVVTLRY
jgi:phosphohistidine phosphatase SixA